MAITVTVNRVRPEANGMQSVRYRADADDGRVRMSSIMLNLSDNPDDYLQKMTDHLHNDFVTIEVHEAIHDYMQNGADVINRVYEYAQRADVTVPIVLHAMSNSDIKEMVKAKTIVDWAQANLTEEYMAQALGITTEEYIRGLGRINAVTADVRNVLDNDKRIRV